MKDAYYFPHDSNAKDDPKMVMLVEQLGLEGYGIYWILIEILRDQPDYKYPLCLLPALARKYRTSTEKIETVVGNYDLFHVENTEEFLSPSLCRRMDKINSQRKRLSEAGKKGRSIQLQQHTGKAQSLSGPCPGAPRAIKGKESKEEKSKEKKIESNLGVFENVFISATDKAKLDEKFGLEVSDKIDALSEYMQSMTKKRKVINSILQINRHHNTD